MNNPIDGIRKAAILVATLNRTAADLLLAEMSPRLARQVRRLADELGPIEPGQCRRVADEFFRAESEARGKRPPGSDAAGRFSQGAPGGSTSGGPRFGFLHETEADRLARMLGTERPQVIALVLSHLPPNRAGEVLGRLEAAVQTDVIRRLVDLEETDPEVLAEVEAALQTRLASQIQMQRRRVAGLPAVAGILEASGQRVSQEILDNLADHDFQLAEELGRKEPAPAEFQFDELARLDDQALIGVLEEVDPKVAILALVGAAPELTRRVLRVLPKADAEVVRERLDHLGPTRLSDVEEARRRIVQLVERLATERRIELRRRRPVVTESASARFVTHA
jgi:flagellar motor switch protein FliG